MAIARTETRERQLLCSAVRLWSCDGGAALKIAGMAPNTLAKHILDCSWSEFFRMLKYKAADAGRRIKEIDPRYTSQECSECGFVFKDNRKTQADFACTSCGHTDNADHNGAVNILARNEPLDANPSRVTLCVV